MVNDLPIQYRYSEMELNAYNAAFYELGFRWHWDSATYHQLLCKAPMLQSKSVTTWKPASPIC